MNRMIVSCMVVWVMVVCNIKCFGCLNEKGKPVDWFVALRVANSRRYMIYDSSSSKKFTEADEGLLDINLKRLKMDDVKNQKILIWNDQPVDGTSSSSKAHAKGFLHFEENKDGMFLDHSIPNFIDTSGGTLSPVTRESSMYGQSLICITLSDRSQAEEIIKHVQAQNSNIYEDTFKIGKAQKPTNNTITLSLPNSFQLITKTSISEEHPFEDMLVNIFNTGWIVNTWARPYKESSCSESIKISNIMTKNIAGMTMRSSQDHSKWALSYGGRKRIVCIGDLNHMNSQASRGGSFLCRQDTSLYRALYSFILEDECQIVQNFTP